MYQYILYCIHTILQLNFFVLSAWFIFLPYAVIGLLIHLPMFNIGWWIYMYMYIYIYIGLNCVSPASLIIGFSVWLITGFYLMPCELVQPCLRVHWTSSKWSRQWDLWQSSSDCWSLLHWGLMKMANILQSTYSKEFLCISIEIFMIFFLSTGVYCVIRQQWLWWWLGNKQAQMGF